MSKARSHIQLTQNAFKSQAGQTKDVFQNWPKTLTGTGVGAGRSGENTIQYIASSLSQNLHRLVRGIRGLKSYIVRIRV